MAVIFTWLLRTTGALIGLTVLAGIGVCYLASRSLPDYDAVVDVQGLQSEVEIVRDNANVPHILGQNDADVFFGLGFAHAQDRLWQMTMLRRTAQGRLSEVFGTATVDIDSFLRRIDIYNRAVESVPAQDQRTLQALDAYSAGVNARIAQVNAEALGRGAPELFLFNTPIAPWRPADSLAVVKLMGVQLSGHLEEEVRRARTSLSLSERPPAGYFARHARPRRRKPARIRSTRARCHREARGASRPFASALSVSAIGHERGLECLGRGACALGIGWHAFGQ